MAMRKGFVLLCVLALVSAQDSDVWPIPDTTTTDLPESVEYQNVLMVWQVLFFGTEVDQEVITATENCYNNEVVGLRALVNQTGQPRENVSDPDNTEYTLWYWAEMRDVDFNFFRDFIVEFTRSLELGLCATGQEILVSLTEAPSQIVVDVDAPVPFWAIYIIIGVLMVVFGVALAFLWWKQGKKPAYEITEYVEAILPKET
ncbi:hypothetical protein NDN08_005985 [Rhodosorus marinus]|uniref:Uncharacterized protein n=1 Tax=Rhodosorus marinus TaxID=101924 RepID=A0AAV8UJG8_9RHOD|nr:hypothetical protein NDN08_005985 [Rhodosorus marinus]